VSAGFDSVNKTQTLCAGGWFECEIHSYIVCAAAMAHGNEAGPGFGQCVYKYAEMQGQWYSGDTFGSAPLDGCCHDHGDMNWGDMVGCAVGVEDSQFIPNTYRNAEPGIAYKTLSDSFAMAAKKGYDPDSGPVILVGGLVSKWPAPGSLFGEMCAGFDGALVEETPEPCR
jgi:hypothetical protein